MLPRKPWSLAAVLTTYYALSAFLVVLLATGYLHWSMVRNMDQVTNQVLTDRTRMIETLLREHSFNMETVVRLLDFRKETDVPVDFFVRVSDARGRIVAQSSGGEKFSTDAFPPPSELSSPFIKDAIVAGRTFRVLSVNAGSSDGFHGLWLIQTALDHTAEEQLVRGSQRNARLTLAVAIGACLVLGYMVARRGIRPLENIARATSSIRAENLGQRLELDGLPNELQSLAVTFNEMLARLQQSFDRLSRFSADIAHELRTPVNNLRGEVDVALGRPRSTEEYVDVLGSALEECDRLTRLIDSLLFVARAEHPQADLERTMCDLREELNIVREFCSVQAEESGVGIRVDCGVGVTVELNRPLFQRAVGNLVANALAYTASGGVVTLRGRPEGERVSVEVEDTGSGIACEHLPHLFDRFYRADSSRAKAGGGTGLGLAIVKSVTDLHSGTVEVASVVGSGTTVRMILPRVGPRRPDRIAE